MTLHRSQVRTGGGSPSDFQAREFYSSHSSVSSDFRVEEAFDPFVCPFGTFEESVSSQRSRLWLHIPPLPWSLQHE